MAAHWISAKYTGVDSEGRAGILYEAADLESGMQYFGILGDYLTGIKGNPITAESPIGSIMLPPEYAGKTIALNLCGGAIVPNITLDVMSVYVSPDDIVPDEIPEKPEGELIYSAYDFALTIRPGYYFQCSSHSMEVPVVGYDMLTVVCDFNYPRLDTRDTAVFITFKHDIKWGRYCDSLGWQGSYNPNREVPLVSRNFEYIGSAGPSYLSPSSYLQKTHRVTGVPQVVFCASGYGARSVHINKFEVYGVPSEPEECSQDIIIRFTDDPNRVADVFYTALGGLPNIPVKSATPFTIPCKQNTEVTINVGITANAIASFKSFRACTGEVLEVPLQVGAPPPPEGEAYLTVTVHDQDDQPIEGAKVVNGAAGTTDASGIYKTALPIGEEVTVTVTKDGYEPATQTDTMPEEGLSIALMLTELGELITQRILVSEESTDFVGDPIEGATVTVNGKSCTEYPDGLYTIEIAEGIEATAEVKAEGYKDKTETFTTDSMTSMPISLEPSIPEGESEQTFTLKDVEGNPIEGATVTVGEESCVTGADGKCTITLPIDEEVTATITKPGYEDATMTITPGEGGDEYSVAMPRAEEVLTLPPSVKGDLDAGVVSDEIKDAFAGAGIPLSDAATIEKQDDGTWKVTDGEDVYSVVEEEGELNVYPGGGAPSPPPTPPPGEITQNILLQDSVTKDPIEGASVTVDGKSCTEGGGGLYTIEIAKGISASVVAKAEGYKDKTETFSTSSTASILVRLDPVTGEPEWDYVEFNEWIDDNNKAKIKYKGLNLTPGIEYHGVFEVMLPPEVHIGTEINAATLEGSLELDATMNEGKTVEIRLYEYASGKPSKIIDRKDVAIPMREEVDQVEVTLGPEMLALWQQTPTLEIHGDELLDYAWPFLAWFPPMFGFHVAKEVTDGKAIFTEADGLVKEKQYIFHMYPQLALEEVLKGNAVKFGYTPSITLTKTNIMEAAMCPFFGLDPASVECENEVNEFVDAYYVANTIKKLVTGENLLGEPDTADMFDIIFMPIIMAGALIPLPVGATLKKTLGPIIDLVHKGGKGAWLAKNQHKMHIVLAAGKGSSLDQVRSLAAAGHWDEADAILDDLLREIHADPALSATVRENLDVWTKAAEEAFGDNPNWATKIDNLKDDAVDGTIFKTHMDEVVRHLDEVAKAGDWSKFKTEWFNVVGNDGKKIKALGNAIVTSDAKAAHDLMVLKNWNTAVGLDDAYLLLTKKSLDDIVEQSEEVVRPVLKSFNDDELKAIYKTLEDNGYGKLATKLKSIRKVFDFEGMVTRLMAKANAGDWVGAKQVWIDDVAGSVDNVLYIDRNLTGKPLEFQRMHNIMRFSKIDYVDALAKANRLSPDLDFMARHLSEAGEPYNYITIWKALDPTEQAHVVANIGQTGRKDLAKILDLLGAETSKGTKAHAASATRKLDDLGDMTEDEVRATSRTLSEQSDEAAKSATTAEKEAAAKAAETDDPVKHPALARLWAHLHRQPKTAELIKETGAPSFKKLPLWAKLSLVGFVYMGANTIWKHMMDFCMALFMGEETIQWAGFGGIVLNSMTYDWDEKPLSERKEIIATFKKFRELRGGMHETVTSASGVFETLCIVFGKIYKNFWEADKISLWALDQKIADMEKGIDPLSGIGECTLLAAADKKGVAFYVHGETKKYHSGAAYDVVQVPGVLVRDDEYKVVLCAEKDGYVLGIQQIRITRDNLNDKVSTPTFELIPDSDIGINPFSGLPYSDEEYNKYAEKPTRYGKIICSTNPTGAKIFLDDVYKDVDTNWTLDYVPVGTHKVTFKLDGYRDCEKVVNVVIEPHAQAFCYLESAEGTIRCKRMSNDHYKDRAADLFYKKHADTDWIRNPQSAPTDGGVEYIEDLEVGVEYDVKYNFLDVLECINGEVLTIPPSVPVDCDDCQLASRLPREINTTVTEVIDGDSFRTRYTDTKLPKRSYGGDLLPQEIRIIGCNCYEAGSPIGQVGKEKLTELIGGKSITLKIDKNRPLGVHNRVIAGVFLPDGSDVAAKLIEACLVREYPGDTAKYRYAYYWEPWSYLDSKWADHTPEKCVRSTDDEGKPLISMTTDPATKTVQMHNRGLPVYAVVRMFKVGERIDTFVAHARNALYASSSSYSYRDATSLKLYASTEPIEGKNEGFEIETIIIGEEPPPDTFPVTFTSNPAGANVVTTPGTLTLSRLTSVLHAQRDSTPISRFLKRQKFK